MAPLNKVKRTIRTADYQLDWSIARRRFSLPFSHYYTLLIISRYIPDNVAQGFAPQIDWMLADVEEMNDKIRLYFYPEIYPEEPPSDDAQVWLFYAYLDLDKQEIKQWMEKNGLDYERHLLIRKYETDNGLVFIDWFLQADLTTWTGRYSIKPYIILHMEEWTYEEREEEPELPF